MCLAFVVSGVLPEEFFSAALEEVLQEWLICSWGSFEPDQEREFGSEVEFLQVFREQIVQFRGLFRGHLETFLIAGVASENPGLPW